MKKGHRPFLKNDGPKRKESPPAGGKHAEERSLSKLAFIQRGVESTAGKQLLMGALLHDMTVSHDENHVRRLDG